MIAAQGNGQEIFHGQRQMVISLADIPHTHTHTHTHIQHTNTHTHTHTHTYAHTHAHTNTHLYARCCSHTAVERETWLLQDNCSRAAHSAMVRAWLACSQRPGPTGHAFNSLACLKQGHHHTLHIMGLVQCQSVNESGGHLQLLHHQVTCRLHVRSTS